VSDSETEVSNGDTVETKITLEPLDTDKHNRENFSCGVTQVDNFLKKTVNKLTKADNLRSFVIPNSDGGIIGFYSTNAHSIDYDQLPIKFSRNRASHGSIPAAYISMIGVDYRFQGKGYGSILLVDCLTKIARAAETIGIAVVMLDVLDCGDEEKVEKRVALYQSYGFQSLPSQRLRMFLPLKQVKALLDD